MYSVKFYDVVEMETVDWQWRTRNGLVRFFVQHDVVPWVLLARPTNIDQTAHDGVETFCPVCWRHSVVWFDKRHRWNGDFDSPTLTGNVTFDECGHVVNCVRGKLVTLRRCRHEQE